MFLRGSSGQHVRDRRIRKVVRHPRFVSQFTPRRSMEHRDQVLSEEDATRIIDHMNEAHEEDLLLFAQVYGGATGATAARMTDIDAEGMDLKVALADGQQELRIDFDVPLHTPEDAHRTLVDMALNARG